MWNLDPASQTLDIIWKTFHPSCAPFPFVFVQLGDGLSGGRGGMAASRSSEDVVTPNASEAERPVKTERDRTRKDGGIPASVIGDRRRAESGTTSASNVVTVPVSMPVGTLIAGTAFNVITSDHLPHFKPMLCVDNGFISGGPVVDESEIKATHIVIQNPPSPTPQSSLPPATTNASTSSWEETANMPVLSIRCKNTSAELHKNRFGSGGRGRCIKLGPMWYTPSEFEALCGRASSKDWKRSIRFGGRSIQTLINEGILTPHATSCTCGACCDDQSALGPVRLFTPYKRRRRTTVDGESEKKMKSRSGSDTVDSEMDLNHTSNSSPSKEAWQTIADGISNSDYHLLDSTEAVATSVIPDASNVLKRLEDIGGHLMKILSEYNECVEEVKIINSRQIERIEQERASSALLAASVDAQVAVSDQAALHSLDENDSKKCANCDREASAECSLCRRTPYCSIFCQRKDWAHHQIECLRSVPPMETSQHQSIMLIVESPHQ